MICPTCGASIPAEANFCMKCGAALSKPESPRKVTRLEVPVSEGNVSAPSSGSQQQSARPSQEARRRWALFAGAAVLVGFIVLAVASAIWFATRRRESQSQSTSVKTTNVNASSASSIPYDKEALREMTLVLASRMDELQAASGAASQNANSTPADRAEPQEGESLGPPASEVRTMRVRFAPGNDSTTISGSVERGQPNRYLFAARAGQRVTLRLSATGDVRLLFHPLDDEGALLSDETRSWSGTLPETGDYAVDVFTYDDKASYQLLIVIQ